MLAIVTPKTAGSINMPNVVWIRIPIDLLILKNTYRVYPLYFCDGSIDPGLAINIEFREEVFVVIIQFGDLSKRVILVFVRPAQYTHPLAANVWYIRRNNTTYQRIIDGLSWKRDCMRDAIVTSDAVHSFQTGAINGGNVNLRIYVNIFIYGTIIIRHTNVWNVLV